MTPVDAGNDRNLDGEDVPEHLDQIEERLRNASQLGRSAEPETDLERLMRRARREVGLRDLVGFGFAHMLTAMLALVATVFSRVQPGSTRPDPARVAQGSESLP